MISSACSIRPRWIWEKGAAHGGSKGREERAFKKQLRRSSEEERRRGWRRRPNSLSDLWLLKTIGEPLLTTCSTRGIWCLWRDSTVSTTGAGDPMDTRRTDAHHISLSLRFPLVPLPQTSPLARGHFNARHHGLYFDAILTVQVASETDFLPPEEVRWLYDCRWTLSSIRCVSSDTDSAWWNSCQVQKPTAWIQAVQDYFDDVPLCVPCRQLLQLVWETAPQRGCKVYLATPDGSHHTGDLEALIVSTCSHQNYRGSSRQLHVMTRNWSTLIVQGWVAMIWGVSKTTICLRTDKHIQSIYGSSVTPLESPGRDGTHQVTLVALSSSKAMHEFLVLHYLATDSAREWDVFFLDKAALVVTTVAVMELC